jgi:hypothetical protein
MPQIIKSKKVKPKPKKKQTLQSKTALTVARSPKLKTKRSSADYYNCLLTYANQNWHHPVTGQKKRITACCKDCKLNAPTLNNQRDQELVKLINSYQQVGDSLAKLLKPIN